MSKIYFEENGANLLKSIGMSKVEFARRMGIRKQNVNALFKTKNLNTIARAASVMGVPFELLIGYTTEPDIEMIATSDISHSFKGRPREAFWYLIDHQEGDLFGVFNRSDLGDIDLLWGDDDCGVRHILLKHINEKDFPTVNLMIDTVTDVILSGNLDKENGDKAVLKKGGYVAVIRKNYRINGKKPESRNWVLTAYSKQSSDTTQAPPGINEGGRAVTSGD